MKQFGVACILLFIAAIFPEPQANSFDVAWPLGLLLALALVGQQLSRTIGIPDVVGWMGAGLLLGEGGLRAIIPTESSSIEVLYTIAAVWVGCLTGLNFKWIKERHTTYLLLVVPILTIVSIAAFAGGLILIADLATGSAFALASIAMFWGPIVTSTLTQKSEPVLLTSLGLGLSIIMVSFAVFLGIQQNTIVSGANSFLFRLWFSAAIGAGLAILLSWSRLLEHQTATIASTSSGLLLLALLISDLQLFPLIAGLSAGIVLAVQNAPNQHLQHILKPKRPLAALAFFSLVGASINPFQLLTVISPGLFKILLLQLIILIVVRVVAPSIWYPLPSDRSTFSRRISLILLPHGAILYEIAFRPGSMFELFSLPFSQLVRQVIIADVILYTVILSIVAVIIERSVERQGNLSHHSQISEHPATPSMAGPS